MDNPGIDLAIWDELKKKWVELESVGNKLKIEFQLIADEKDKEKILAIDVIQYVNEDIFIQTVQRNIGEAYTILGIAGLSIERLVEVYKEMMHQLHRQIKKRDADLIVIMSPSSPSSGVVEGYVEMRNPEIKSSVLTNYQHYYMLNALREKMIGLLGDGWSKVKAVYRSGELEFYFEY